MSEVAAPHKLISANSSVASSASSAPLLPHPQSSQHDVTPGTLEQKVTTPQPELLGTSPSHTASILCVNSLVQALLVPTVWYNYQL